MTFGGVAANISRDSHTSSAGNTTSGSSETGSASASGANRRRSSSGAGPTCPRIVRAAIPSIGPIASGQSRNPHRRHIAPTGGCTAVNRGPTQRIMGGACGTRSSAIVRQPSGHTVYGSSAGGVMSDWKLQYERIHGAREAAGCRSVYLMEPIGTLTR